jgi:hypothetical protein
MSQKTGSLNFFYKTVSENSFVKNIHYMKKYLEWWKLQNGHKEQEQKRGPRYFVVLSVGYRLHPHFPS